MSNVPVLLDRLKDWIVGYDRGSKPAAEVAIDMEAHNGDLLRLVEADALTDQELAAYGVVMSLADARGLFDDPEDLES